MAQAALFELVSLGLILVPDRICLVLIFVPDRVCLIFIFGNFLLKFRAEFLGFLFQNVVFLGDLLLNKNVLLCQSFLCKVFLELYRLVQLRRCQLLKKGHRKISAKLTIQCRIITVSRVNKLENGRKLRNNRFRKTVKSWG
ncbi:hypothetical protein [Roseinatronobacter monicus]|uniref:hypothetical protein n=1 Tax=Roseinatronobacter monicus TaxID=393481 RepID=UPI00115049C3|nr:hypothetical protein [Roseinatronobacter monicus]